MTDSKSFYFENDTVTAVSHSIQTAYDSIDRAVSTDRGGAGVTSWAYDVSGRTAAISGPGFSASLHYADGPGTPRYNGFLSSMTWRGPGDAADRGYKYEYDGLGRLTDAVYGEGPGLDRHKNRYNETVLEYSANSMPKRLQRRGLKQDGEYGKVDNLHIRLDGNRVASVTDDALPVLRPGATDFNDADSGNTYEYDYDACGRLTRDDNRRITAIDYDNLGNPRLVSFADGSSTSYVYAPDGRKLRVIHRTAITPAGTPGSPSGVFVSDTTDYAGSVERVLIDGGHATLDASGSATYHFHTLDHLGNVRAVVNDRGLVEQHTHYYPYGGIFADASSGQDLQPLKYNGKELDRVHGLDTYDYGFRQYYPMVPMWDRMDQLSESYTHISPYAYCAANPVVIGDSDGRILDTVWDVGSVIYDLGAALYNHATGDHAGAVDHWVDLGVDAAAALIPGVPAGLSKAARAADKAIDAAKAADKVVDSSKGLKNAARIAEGKQFEKEVVQQFKAEGRDITTQVTVVPQNGLGNIPGNRTKTDIIENHGDGTFGIFEIKLTDKVPLSTGQNKAKSFIGGKGTKFEVRSKGKEPHKQGTIINITTYDIKYKYKLNDF